MPERRTIVDDKDVRSKFNNTGATILKGRLVKLDTTDGQIVVLAVTTDAMYGVALHDIPDKTWGDIQIRGKAKVIASAAIAVGAQLMSATGGKVATWTAAAGTNANMVGLGENAAAADLDEIEAELAGPGVFKQG